ncbi:MAG: hypothetical protein ACLPZR_23130 [Solirubrobacteraceae bacterium]
MTSTTPCTLQHPLHRPPRADDPLQPHPICREHRDPIAHHRLDLRRSVQHTDEFEINSSN